MARRQGICKVLVSCVLVFVVCSGCVTMKPADPDGIRPTVTPGGCPHFGVITSGSTAGMRVTYVDPVSAAQDAGIEVGDIITEFAGKKYTKEIEFVTAIRAQKVGETIKVKVLRRERNIELQVKLRSCSEPYSLPSAKFRQEDKESQPEPRFKTRLDIMMCSLYVGSGADTTHAELDEMFESELPEISNAATCPRLEIAFDVHRQKTGRVAQARKTLLLYGFEQEYKGEAFLSHDVIFKEITFLQGDYVSSHAKLGCLGAIFRWTSEERVLEENKLGYTVCLDLGLQYQNFSVKLNSGGISRTRSDHSTVPFVGIRAKLTFYDRASVFAEGALFVPELFILFRHLSAGLSCYLTEDLEVSIAYLQQLYGFSGNFDFHPGFKGWSFALTFRI